MGAILVVGSGGREHAIGRRLFEAGEAVIFTPGNPGTLACGDNAPASGLAEIVALAQQKSVEFVVVGPEQPLVDGLGDRLRAARVPCVGPNQAAAQLEASKRFTRKLCAPLRVPAPRFAVVRDAGALQRAVAGWGGIPVVKADGLAAGKGVFLPDTQEECVRIGLALLAGSLGAAGKTVVLEDRLTGVEASLFFACHGSDIVALPHARDHKRLGDGDTGPNTGGMGAISPNPLIDDGLVRDVERRVVRPVLQSLAAAGTPFSGFLFVGLMLTEAGPQLLEFNVRLGDPEAQAILPRIAPKDFAQLCRALARGQLQDVALTPLSSATCAIVLASAGYPETARRGDAIAIDTGLSAPDRWLIHAGTANCDGHVVTNGGRVATLVATAATVEAAVAHAYAGVPSVHFPGMQFRRDIGASKEAAWRNHPS